MQELIVTETWAMTLVCEACGHTTHHKSGMGRIDPEQSKFYLGETGTDPICAECQDGFTRRHFSKHSKVERKVKCDHAGCGLSANVRYQADQPFTKRVGDFCPRHWQEHPLRTQKVEVEAAF